MKKFMSFALIAILSTTGTHALAGNNDDISAGKILNTIDNIFGKDKKDKTTQVSITAVEKIRSENIQKCIATGGGSACLASSDVTTNQNASTNQKLVQVGVTIAKKVDSRNEQTAKVSGGGKALASSGGASNQNAN